jgi:hypothetical protein
MVSLAPGCGAFEYRGDVKIAALVVSGVVLSAAAGCGGSGSAPSVAASPRPIPTPTCPSATATAAPTSPGLGRALRKIPFDLPMPDNITVVDATTTTDGIQVVKFTTATTLRQAVLFIVDRYPKAGYVLGRGDAEATEADAPFVKNKVRGLTRVASIETCKTLWLVASVATKANQGGTSPILSPHPTSSQTSALPFG